MTDDRLSASAKNIGGQEEGFGQATGKLCNWRIWRWSTANAGPFIVLLSVG